MIEMNQFYFILVAKACASPITAITDITGPHHCQSTQDPQDTSTTKAAKGMVMYSCTDDLCNVEKNICEDCQLTEDLDVCRRYSKPDNEGSESNGNNNDAKNVTKIDTNQGFTITLNVFLFYCTLCFI